MAKVDEQLSSAVENQEYFSGSHTVLASMDGWKSAIATLHGNRIAEINYAEHHVTLRNPGYLSVTVKNRMNAVLDGLCVGDRVVKRNKAWYVGDRRLMDGITLRF